MSTRMHLVDEETSLEQLADLWRLEQLLKAGYPNELAESLAADRTVDLHVAVKLLARGCAPDVAAAILL